MSLVITYIIATLSAINVIIIGGALLALILGAAAFVRHAVRGK